MPGNWKNIIQTILQKKKNFLGAKNLTDFRKTVETGVDLRLIFSFPQTDLFAKDKKNNNVKWIKITTKRAVVADCHTQMFGRLFPSAVLSRKPHRSLFDFNWVFVSATEYLQPSTIPELKNSTLTKTKFGE